MQYTPNFPRAVSGADWRLPLDHPELEAIAKRADHLYRCVSLSEDHRARMLLNYARLIEAEKTVSTMIGESRLDDPGARPAKPISGDGSQGEKIASAIGFAFRFQEWLVRLEDLYGVTAWRIFGQVQNRDDETEDAIPHPGEDF